MNKPDWSTAINKLKESSDLIKSLLNYYIRVGEVQLLTAKSNIDWVTGYLEGINGQDVKEESSNENP